MFTQKQILFITIHKYFLLSLNWYFLFFSWYIIHEYTRKSLMREELFSVGFTQDWFATQFISVHLMLQNVDLPQFLVRPVYVIKSMFYLYAFCVDNCLQFFIKTMLGYTKWRLLFSFQKHLRTKYCTSHSFALKSHCNPFRKLLHSMRLKFNYVIFIIWAQ